MASRLRLEVFTNGEAESDSTDVSAAALEEARLAAYETGYSAGWEDAIAAQSNDQTRIHADLARNLQTLSFTYHEARSHVLRMLEPLLRDMVAKVLPDIARQSLGEIVLETLRPAAAKLGDAPVTVVLHPGSRAAVEPFLQAQGTMPFTILEEPTLGEGQVYLRFADTEQQIDLDGVIAAIAGAVDTFFHIEQEERAYG